MVVRRISRMIFDKRAVSNVVSVTILTGAVIALSLAVFGWAQSRSSDYNSEIGETVDAETARLMEKLAFEYMFYDYPNLTVFVLNCGTIDDLKIKTVYIYDSSNALIEIFSNPPLYSFQSWAGIPGQALDRGGEGRLVLSLLDLSSGFWTIKVVTGRGATFDSGFVV
ncbi:MAG: hypothetical protein ACE5IF_05810 [Candidatus Bathyarchaeia archaeon]